MIHIDSSWVYLLLKINAYKHRCSNHHLLILNELIKGLERKQGKKLKQKCQPSGFIENISADILEMQLCLSRNSSYPKKFVERKQVYGKLKTDTSKARQSTLFYIISLLDDTKNEFWITSFSLKGCQPNKFNNCVANHSHLSKKYRGKYNVTNVQKS